MALCTCRSRAPRGRRASHRRGTLRGVCFAQPGLQPSDGVGCGVLQDGPAGGPRTTARERKCGGCRLQNSLDTPLGTQASAFPTGVPGMGGGCCRVKQKTSTPTR
ncbi:hypothetical protein NDU88_005218 [Pleurodeles waltl]|uniref:Uncharacterized protein n=1 Tax=Pleurodeles waltl TaxID=8319 RepID=A0AAV7UI50_PLEWA|nr:hypothetical protein NDU88_005218 [Pleurodeles waltl]